MQTPHFGETIVRLHPVMGLGGWSVAEIDDDLGLDDPEDRRPFAVDHECLDPTGDQTGRFGRVVVATGRVDLVGRREDPRRDRYLRHDGQHSANSLDRHGLEGHLGQIHDVDLEFFAVLHDDAVRTPAVGAHQIQDALARTLVDLDEMGVVEVWLTRIDIAQLGLPALADESSVELVFPIVILRNLDLYHKTHPFGLVSIKSNQIYCTM